MNFARFVGLKSIQKDYYDQKSNFKNNFLLVVNSFGVKSNHGARAHAASPSCTLSSRRLTDPSVPDLQSMVAR